MIWKQGTEKLTMGYATANSNSPIWFSTGREIDHSFFSVTFSGQEKKLVEEVFNNAIDCLSDEDKTLPQVKDNIIVTHQ